jgi:hypothetical protein
MPYVSVNLDTDLHVKASKYANGIGVDLGEVCARALAYALASRYPDQGLPGDQPGVDNELPRPPFDGTVDNELPEGEVPVDPGYGVGEEGPSTQPLPPGRNPNLNPDLNPDVKPGQPDQGLPPTEPEPKKK